MLVNHKIQFFLIILFVWINVLISIGMEGLVGYARHISNVDSAREGDLRVPKPERPPSRSHPVGHGRSYALLCVLRCWLLSVCCGTQNGTLCRSGF